MDRIEKLKQFLRDTPDDSFLKHALAMEYIKAGNDVGAEKLLIEILELQPGYTGSYYHLAKLYERKKEVQIAIDIYEKGMEVAKAAGDNHALNELRGAWEELCDL